MDYVAAVFIVSFTVAMIFLFTGYSKIVQQRLAVDNIAKEYLYIAEENGFLTSSNIDSLVNDLEKAGCYRESIDLTGTTITQVAYGGRVTVSIYCEYDNPLFTLFTKQISNTNDFHVDESTVDNDGNKVNGTKPKLKYSHSISSTSKW